MNLHFKTLLVNTGLVAN
jgi:hypothetical protein